MSLLQISGDTFFTAVPLKMLIKANELQKHVRHSFVGMRVIQHISN